MATRIPGILAALLLVGPGITPTADGDREDEPFGIQVVETTSGWPVPLVTLRTTGNLSFVTDNAGMVAVDAPELMGREVWFGITADGYAAAADGFGLRGVRLTPESGARATVTVARTGLARRLGRITGAGQFAESQRLGAEPEWRESGVVGCDSVQNAVYGDRLFWLWGDTALFRYPLGVFDATCATTALRPIDRFEPPVRLSLDYFRNEQGRPRGVAPMPGPGPTWLTGLASLPDVTGRARLVACYAKIRKPMNVYEWGLCAWDDEAQAFERVCVVWTEETIDGAPVSGDAQAVMTPPMPPGHAVRWTDTRGVEWILFGNPLPTRRCRATFEAWRDVEHWEAMTAQPSLGVAGAAPDRVTPHSGSIAWHPWRSRWVTVFTEQFGRPSAFGEVWYAEADAPTGPWGPAVEVLSHANYTFYNPRIHAEWLRADAPMLVFEGTCSQMFADRPAPTPRYDYNQVLYRLDLDDPAFQVTAARP